MQRRSFLAGSFAWLVAMCGGRKPRKLHAAIDQAAPDGDASAVAIVSIPPRHAMSQNVRITVHRVEVVGADPDRYAFELMEKFRAQQRAGGSDLR